MTRKFLFLNVDKTEMLILGPKQKRLPLKDISVNFDRIALKTENQVRNLGVVMAAELNLNSHIKPITKSAYHHLKNTARLRGLMSQQGLEKLVHAFIFSRLGYCNGIFTGMSKKPIRQLQLIQNTATRVLTKTRM
ncbi:hypothetical protein LDENG_00125940 [Lucifuga dentata]|nr:hypothetical protein LDENG_00125940 [Lucifuga dentata]